MISPGSVFKPKNAGLAGVRIALLALAFDGQRVFVTRAARYPISTSSPDVDSIAESNLLRDGELAWEAP